MNRDLERLIALYKEADESPDSRREETVAAFEEACREKAKEADNPIRWEQIAAYVKRVYLQSLASENRRKGRPKK